MTQHCLMDDPKAIGARIRLARKRKGLTQADLAAGVGVTRSHLTNVEGGNDSLSLEKLSILASETGTTVAWLIGEGGPDDPLEVDLLAAFRGIDQRDRESLVRIAQSFKRQEPPAPEPKSRGPDLRPFWLGGDVQKRHPIKAAARRAPGIP